MTKRKFRRVATELRERENQRDEDGEKKERDTEVLFSILISTVFVFWVFPEKCIVLAACNEFIFIFYFLLGKKGEVPVL